VWNAQALQQWLFQSELPRLQQEIYSLDQYLANLQSRINTLRTELDVEQQDHGFNQELSKMAAIQNPEYGDYFLSIFSDGDELTNLQNELTRLQTEYSAVWQRCMALVSTLYAFLAEKRFPYAPPRGKTAPF